MRDYGLTWRFFGLYGNSEPDHKRHTWSLLKRLSNLSPLPWLYSGGFNEILEPWKKGEDCLEVRRQLMVLKEL